MLSGSIGTWLCLDAAQCHCSSTPTPKAIKNHVYPGGRALASTISSASFVSSSLGPKRGDRGSAMRPVLADSKMPNGAISFMKESILVGFAELFGISKRTFVNS